MARETSPATKARIVLLKKQGYSNRAIARELGNIDPTTAGRIARKYGNGRSVYETGPRPGRPPKLSFREARYAALLLARFPPRNATAIQRRFFPHISARTLRRHLRKLGLRSYIARKVNLTKQQQRLARCSWARAHLSWPQSWLDLIIFSDECKVNLIGPDGRQYYWRHPSVSPLDPRFTIPWAPYGGGSLMVWGCITRQGVGRLRLVQGTMDSKQYVSILQDALFGTLSDYSITPRAILFQHDRDSKHMSSFTRGWLQRQNISVLPWPAKSPDLNPIEHVWAHLKRRVYRRNPPPHNLRELWVALQAEWGKISPRFIAKLYDSLHKRMRQVLLNKGRPTRY